MIKVIIERQVKKGEDISLLLLEIRAAAMRQPGYVTGETLLSTEDSFNIVTISTWRTLEDWKAFQKKLIPKRPGDDPNGLGYANRIIKDAIALWPKRRPVD